MQSLKPGGTVRLLEDCRLVFDPKTRGLQVNNCIGMEIGENTYYIKAETASSYNGWLKVSCILHALYCMHLMVGMAGGGFRYLVVYTFMMTQFYNTVTFLISL